MGRGTAHNLNTVRALKVKEDFSTKPRCQHGRCVWGWLVAVLLSDVSTDTGDSLMGVCLMDYSSIFLTGDPAPQRTRGRRSARRGKNSSVPWLMAELACHQALTSPHSYLVNTSLTPAPVHFKPLFPCPNENPNLFSTINYLLKAWVHVVRVIQIECIQARWSSSSFLQARVTALRTFIQPPGGHRVLLCRRSRHALPIWSHS